MAVRRAQATLSPAAVGAATSAEQTFTVGGGDLPIGAQVNVTKPTAQAGIGIVNARVVSATQIGITFMNATAGGVTPTAGEVYQFVIVD